MAQVRAVVFGAWINVLLAFVPAGLFPSGAMLSFAIDELVLRLGDTFGGLLSMTFSRQIIILQTSLLGSVLSNLLLMTGLGFSLSGIGCLEQYLNPLAAQTISILLLLAVLSILVPTASHLMTKISPAETQAQSRGTCVVILISYALWLIFQLKTNRSMFNEPSRPISKAKKPLGTIDRGAAQKGIAQIGAGTAAAVGGSVNKDQLFDSSLDDNDDAVYFSLSLAGGIVTLVACVVLIAFNTQFATDSLNDPSFVKMAVRDKMDISTALTLERCMQTSLMVLPLIVLLAWCMSIDDMSMEFDGFSIAALFASIIIMM
ncbi:uncharacterized protein BDZ99DRAFT_509377 [Mytilinidion resinicola]|uniref:Sodium/calcium exchanger membrane region domain-containing protein n=1 Tax=Mytilinidion resinicola TaxID=574789 RepID=A0A6A6YK84_9PEZI|nr:uncharacterized protein BDZ99DRAFT_509377 [Mytilinidion resinicola]KAF2808959.1 hypothetical protein BDZ99DRAFT_509377 [Mytilinidion resinicola]